MERFSGNLMTPFAAGAYVSWMCYPQVRVSIDGRYEVAYREDVLPKHNRFYAGEVGWQQVLSEFAADAILVQANSPIKDLIQDARSNTQDWSLVYSDQAFTVFIKDKPGGQIPVSMTGRRGAAD
jgi:hypothetical protein